MKNYLLLFVFLLMGTFAMAQTDYSFKVLANKGNNKVESVNKRELNSLKPGLRLFAGETLITSDSSYVGLMHSSGRTIEVRGKSTTPISDLVAKVLATKNTSVASRYARFVIDRINEVEETDHRKRIYVTGAVSRTADSESIYLLYPETSDFIQNKLTISWIPPVSADELTYVVHVYNIFNEEFLSTEVDNTSLTIDFSDPSMDNDVGLYIVKVEVDGNPNSFSNEIGLKRLDIENNLELLNDIKVLSSEIKDDTPMNKLVYASFYEENGLLADALSKFNEVIELAPDVEEFEQLKIEFLLRNGIIR